MEIWNRKAFSSNTPN